jgi:agmatine/peptidylarginine deiminase
MFSQTTAVVCVLTNELSIFYFSNQSSSLLMTTISRRLPAEWEQQSRVQLTFPHRQSDWAEDYEEVLPIFIKIAEEIAKRQEVLVVCQDKEATAQRLAHLNPQNLLLASIPSNDTWARDYAPLTVIENGKKIHLDFTFNGWGNKFRADLDNQVTQHLSKRDFLKHKVEIIDFVLEGGAIESDGKGTLLTTTRCLLSKERNPKFSNEEKIKYYLGANRLLWLQHGYLEGDDTDAHIDTLVRFCAEDTIAYVAPPTDKSDSHYQEFEKMREELRRLRTAEGKPYRLFALPFAKPVFHPRDGHRLPATYANFLIINGAVLMPTYRDPEKDAEAADILAIVFPDREIVGIDCLPVIRQHGSLHCLTMQYPA